MLACDERIKQKEVRFHMLHLFCGIGGGAYGSQQSSYEYKGVTGKFETLCGIDNDLDACKDFTRLTGAPALCIDLFSREQYIAFHGHEPPEDWEELTPYKLRALVLRISGGIMPTGVFLSPPCKGFSPLLPEFLASSPKYQALNGLVDRSIWLVMEAFKDDPVAFVIIENVPRIKSRRGAAKLFQVKSLLSSYNYLLHEQVFDAGELGALGQIRKRYILLARRPQKIKDFIYQPIISRVKAIGEVLEKLPMPGDVERAGEMHRMPNCTWNTSVRLAMIPAGEDWRALPEEFGYDAWSGAYKIIPWNEPSNVVNGATRGVGQSNGASAVADPRVDKICGYSNKFRVVKMDEPSTTITGSRLGSGATIVADSRIPDFANLYKVVKMDEPCCTITGGAAPSNGAISVADTRFADVKDMRSKSGKTNWSGAGVMGVNRWDEPCKTITASGDIHAGMSAVQDPRIPDGAQKGVFVIISRDASWHRSLSTFECAMLQGLPFNFPDGSPLVLSARSDAMRRQHIGNLVPPPSACAMFNAILQTLLPNFLGDTCWGFSDDVLWVKERITVPDYIVHSN